MFVSCATPKCVAVSVVFGISVEVTVVAIIEYLEVVEEESRTGIAAESYRV